MRRDTAKLVHMADPEREHVSLPLGPEGAYFVGGIGMLGQDRDPSVIDHNSPPEGQPGLWCQWIPTEDGMAIVWDEGEKFYDYVEWLSYLIEHFLQPWGYVVNGEVSWQGEDPTDRGTIIVRDNIVRTSSINFLTKEDLDKELGTWVEVGEDGTVILSTPEQGSITLGAEEAFKLLSVLYDHRELLCRKIMERE
jgi:hypothetical protein